jgi:hypothetical protein
MCDLLQILFGVWLIVSLIALGGIGKELERIADKHEKL